MSPPVTPRGMFQSGQPVNAGRLAAVEITPRGAEVARLREELKTASPRRRREIRRRFKAIRATERHVNYGGPSALVGDFQARQTGGSAGVVYQLDAKSGMQRRVTAHKFYTKKERRRQRGALLHRQAARGKLQDQADSCDISERPADQPGEYATHSCGSAGPSTEAPGEAAGPQAPSHLAAIRSGTLVRQVAGGKECPSSATATTSHDKPNTGKGAA